VQERMFGIETEYAVTGSSIHGTSLARELLVPRLIEKARQKFASLPDLNRGLFFGNGSRFYGDCGHHPELATPECTNPWDTVRYVLAGERMLYEMTRELESDKGNLSLKLFKCNVDYSGSGSTWGCHESYLHRADQRLLSKQIIPHLVTRIIYTGAGGFKSMSPGLRFTLSPRVQHLEAVRSENSTRNRGIFHTKDESLSQAGFHRLHLICGESLCSETAMWLKVATTALVVAMAEAGVCLVDASIELRDPRYAMRQIAARPRVKVAVGLTDQRFTTALGIQRHYLERAEAHLQDSFMPPWADEACRQWRAILNRLERGPEAVAATLDWAIKLALYQDYASRRGFLWERVELWTRIHGRLRNKLKLANRSDALVPLSVLLRPESPVRTEVKTYLRDHGLEWEEFDEFLRLRQQLFEIDTRFGQLGPESVFAALHQQGVLDHHLAGVDAIEVAMNDPPMIGRARARGEFIKKVRGRNERYLCDWGGVLAADDMWQLDLSDPFASEEVWRKVDSSSPDNWSMSARVSRLLSRVSP
jgi:hypothetical protein